jgi:tRNA A37 threonylcarbamoyladenosine synthetase subunit TsaC/SUA5/YrdC
MDSPLAVTSANPSGGKPATTGAAAKRYFMGKADLIIDGGRCPGGEVSTVLDATGTFWSVLRPGAVSQQELLKYFSGAF